MTNSYTFIKGTSPIVATAIHEGHDTRDELGDLFNLTDEERLREEDPFTANWLNVSAAFAGLPLSKLKTFTNKKKSRRCCVFVLMVLQPGITNISLNHNTTYLNPSNALENQTHPFHFHKILLKNIYSLQDKRISLLIPGYSEYIPSFV